jgi:hypothetical protein
MGDQLVVVWQFSQAMASGPWGFRTGAGLFVWPTSSPEVTKSMVTSAHNRVDLPPGRSQALATPLVLPAFLCRSKVPCLSAVQDEYGQQSDPYPVPCKL